MQVYILFLAAGTRYYCRYGMLLAVIFSGGVFRYNYSGITLCVSPPFLKGSIVTKVIYLPAWQGCASGAAAYDREIEAPKCSIFPVRFYVNTTPCVDSSELVTCVVRAPKFNLPVPCSPV